MWQHRDLLLVGGFALTLRLIMLALTADTYDYDEFVVLLLGRDTAHGAVPYRDFLFFHPPGVLALLAAVEPLTRLWWPSGRILMVAIDSASAMMVWRIGVLRLSRRTGLFAGLLYGLSPVALISAVRVGQDPLITALGILGLLILAERRSSWAAIAAGGCLGLAVWVKFPGLYFLPVYLLVAPRRSLAILAGFVLGMVGLFLPFHAELHQLYRQTIDFQRARWDMAGDQRIESTVLFWLAASVPAVIGLFHGRRPPWLIAGFLMGVLFGLSSQVYYHYFVVVVPFAALLGARTVERLVGANLRHLVTTGAIGVVCWGLVIARGGSRPLYVTAAHLSDIAPTIRLLNRETLPDRPILSDRFEYPYLADRPSLLHYFWNVGVLVNAQYLEERLAPADAVVMSYGASSGFPPGFEQYLDARLRRVDTAAATTWLRQAKK